MSLGNIEQGTAGIKKQAKELIEQAYQRGFKAGREYSKDWEKDQADRLIEQGRNEAWEAAHKLVSMEYWKCNEVLGDGVLTIETNDEIFTRCTASEAINKLRAYEEQKKQKEDSEIHVGDEVIHSDWGTKAVVLDFVDDERITVYGKNGFTVDWRIDMARKTGRTFPEVVEVLKKLKEGE